MDVIIENKKDGTGFELEIWFFSTVLKIKEKIHKHHGVPVDKQTLYISGVAMEDDRDRKGKNNTVKIIVNVLATRKRFELDVEDGKTVEQLQQMINVEPLTVGRKALVVGEVEMEDAQRTLRDYGVVEGTEVVVLLMITVNVRGYTKTEKIIDVEVNMTDNVSELRKKLKRLKDLHQLVLLDVGFVFVHKQEAMDEGRSFLWHAVKHNDTMDAFPNFVTGGED
ncbi:Ubiquitin-like protein [Dioscorea alata]|uniref:Ubiquitin-like protein n=1 Tax=Dioscorea alata TaxID=55571 RepID=A0ACB7TYC1_DIOAL|nr:Ubiquitin-like protein [Dioscorea alata]